MNKTWLISILTTIVLAAGSAWVGYVQSQVTKTNEKAEQQRDSIAGTKQDTAVIREKVQRLEDDVKEIKTDQKDQGKKLDELLRRVR